MHFRNGKLLSLRLGDIEDGGHPEPGDGHVPQLLHRSAVGVPFDLVGERVHQGHFLRLRDLHGSDDLDALLSPFHLPAELRLPGPVSRHQSGVRALGGDEDGVVEAVG